MIHLPKFYYFFRHCLKSQLRTFQTFQNHFAKPNHSIFHSNPTSTYKFNHTHTYTERSTIFALSTAPGMAAIAVVRVSGPSTRDVFYKIVKRKKLPPERRATLCRLKDPETDEVLDKALALWFPSPNSFTGEDLCELHIHGGVAVIKSVLNALQKLPNFRFAEPGEFTKRAFMADKLDLTEVEGLADLLHAETEAQQKQALRQMDGSLHKLYCDWTERVKICLARLEAYIDFSEDQHLDETILSSVKSDLAVLRSEISSHVLDKRKGEKLRNGVFTVLVGRPNVGKSSLLNILCRRDVAIVSPTAGTTRDIIESSLNLGGYLVNICDTAGIRETHNSIEQEGVKRAKQRSSNADMLIFIMEAKRALDLIHSSKLNGRQLMTFLIKEELGQTFLQDLQFALSNDIDANSSANMDHYSDASARHSHVESDNFILLLNKIDLLSEADLVRIKRLEDSLSNVCAVSCVDGLGMDSFVDAFAKIIKNICCGHRGEEPTITQERHRHHLQKCLLNMSEYQDNLQLDTGIAADNLRNAMNELGKITGKIRTEDILDVVFKDFCIGK